VVSHLLVVAVAVMTILMTTLLLLSQEEKESVPKVFVQSCSSNGKRWNASFVVEGPAER
jgi:NADH:ubiquinone oxidoreductase subunit D